MELREISTEEFKNFSLSHPLNSFYQSLNYAIVMAEEGYEYEFVGYFDENDKLIAASLILYKQLNGIYFGYAPRGFLIDYFDTYTLKKFTDDLINFYYEKQFAFIKINPNIQMTEENLHLKEKLKSFGYLKLKDNMYFESLLPRYNAVIDLKNYKTSDLKKYTRNKIRKGIRKGLTFTEVSIDKMNILDTLAESKNFYYNDFYNVFSKTNEANLFVVSIDKLKFLENSQNAYINESDINQHLNDKMVKRSHSNNINKKMNSDMALLAYKKDIMDASKLAENLDELIIAAALVVNSNGKSEIIASGYDKKYKRFCPNYYLHYSIIKHYKKCSSKLNIGGICADDSADSPYYGLNQFKKGFNPTIEENIGEFDLVISKKAYEYLLKNKYIQNEFSKK